jgi:hypothetical protein
MCSAAWDVEIGKRLVKQQHARLYHDGARKRYALLLPAGKLNWESASPCRQAASAA